MEITQKICLEVKKGDQTFCFYMPVGTTWGNCIDAAFELLQEVSKMANQAVDAAKPQEVAKEN